MTGHPRWPGGLATLPRRSAPGAEPLTAIASAAVATTSVALTAAGLAILARRMAGGFAVSPTAGIAWFVVAAGLAGVWAVDTAVVHRLAGRWVAAVARAGLLVAALAMLPTVGPGSLVGQAAVVAAVGAALVPPPAIADQRRSWTLRRSGRSDTSSPPRLARPGPAAGRHDHARPGAAGEVPGFRQRFARFAPAGGEDRVIGQVLVELAAGSRSGHAHVGFCPPFAALPAVEVTTDYDGVEAIVTAAEVVPWGVRVECRLLEPAEEPVAIPVDLVARHPA